MAGSLLRQSPIGPLASPSLGRLSCQMIPSAYILQLPMKTIVELLIACEMAGGRRRGALSERKPDRQDLHRSSVAVDADAGHVCPIGRVSLARSATAELNDEKPSPGLDCRLPVYQVGGCSN